MDRISCAVCNLICRTLQAANLKSFGFNRDDGEASETLANLIHSSPIIERVVVYDGLGKQTSRTLATLDSTSWSKLRLLDLETDTSPEFVPVLGRLPLLEALNINPGTRTQHPSFKASPSGPLFPRLTLLRAFGTDLGSTPTRLLLCPESAPRLTDLTLIAEDDTPTANYLQVCFSTFLSNRPALTDVTVFVPTVRLSPESQATLDTIQPLFGLKGLTNLTVSLPFALNDVALRTIPKTWPSLQTLNLGGKNQPHHRTDVTLGGLTHLVANSPRMRHLTLNFDDSAKSPDPQVE